jgi:serine/threonine protein kinase
MNCPNCQNPLRDTNRFCTACGSMITRAKRPASDNSETFRTHYDPASEETVVRSDRLIGRLLDSKYEILARLGEGGMGTVYRARRLHIGDEVAVKILHSRFVAEKDGLERFRREARAAAMLHHPNVVTIHDFGESVGAAAPAFMVMELISGTSLRGLLRREGRLSVVYAVRLMSQICAGVAAAHRQNIIHRDLKPDNILIPSASDEEEYGMAKVVDFGIAKLRDLAATHTLTLTGDVIGTPYYMSPEQCRGESLDARSDVYSLGAMLYEMLAGVRPFISHTPTAVVAKQLTEPPPPFPASLAIPPALEAAIMRALAKDANARQADASVFSRDIKAALEQSATFAGGRAKTPVERIEVPLQPQFDDKRQQANLKIHEATPKRSQTAFAFLLVAIILVVLGAGVLALLVAWRNQTINQQAALSNHNQNGVQMVGSTESKPSATLPAATNPSANANQTPAVVATAKELPAHNSDKNKPEREETTENKPFKKEPDASTVNVTGSWQSFYGNVKLSQAGTAISGSIWYADGSGTGRISGTLNGRKLTFSWKDDTSTYNGAGTVTLSANGQALTGSIRLNGATQPLELHR